MNTQENEEIFSVTVDDTVQNSKPTKVEAGKISSRFKLLEGTFSEFVESVVQPYSYTWCPAIFTQDGVRDNNLWKEQQFFGLDIDKGITFEDAMKRLEYYGIEAALVYSTFSSNETNNKFRLVFISPVMITDIRVRNAIHLALQKLFPESDQSIKDPARMFFGGKEAIYRNDNARLDIVKLFEAVTLFITSSDEKNARQNVKLFSQAIGIDMINGLPRVSYEDESISKDFTTHPFKYIIAMCDDFLKKGAIVFYFNKGATVEKAIQEKKYGKVDNIVAKRDVHRRVNWNNLYERCEVFRDFMNGVDVHHEVTYVVASNLIFLEGGITKFFDGLRKRDVYDEDKWKGIINYISRMYAYPTNYDKIQVYYPDAKDIAEANNIVEAAKLPKGGIRMYEEKPMITVKEAEMKFDKAFNEALNAKDKRITVIKVSPGLGKTEAYLKLKNVTIALPYHLVKNEIAQRMIDAGNDVAITPELPNDFDEYITEAIDRLYKSGATKSANKYIRELVETNAQAAQYIEDLNEALNISDTPLLTTHARLFYLKKTHDTIIIDEDIMPTLLPQSTVKIDDLDKASRMLIQTGLVRKVSIEDKALTAYVKFVQEAIPNVIYEMPDIPGINLRQLEKAIATNKIDKKEIKSNVLNFYTATHFYKDGDTVMYINRRTLPQKNIVILSATASEMMYSLLFGDRLHFIDIGLVENKGDVRQDARKGYSRNQLARNPNLIGEIIEKAEGYQIITYKEYATKLKAVAHFGGLAGLNHLAGKPLFIAGTPALHPAVYSLYASALGIKLTPQDYSGMEYIPVRRNGYEYRAMTYQHSELREIQLHLIESELIQAVGRGRYIRQNGKAMIASSVPVPGAKLTAIAA